MSGSYHYDLLAPEERLLSEVVAQAIRDAMWRPLGVYNTRLTKIKKQKKFFEIKDGHFRYKDAVEYLKSDDYSFLSFMHCAKYNDININRVRKFLELSPKEFNERMKKAGRKQ